MPPTAICRPFNVSQETSLNVSRETLKKGAFFDLLEGRRVDVSRETIGGGVNVSRETF